MAPGARFRLRRSQQRHRGGPPARGAARTRASHLRRSRCRISSLHRAAASTGRPALPHCRLGPVSAVIHRYRRYGPRRPAATTVPAGRCDAPGCTRRLACITALPSPRRRPDGEAPLCSVGADGGREDRRPAALVNSHTTRGIRRRSCARGESPRCRRRAAAMCPLAFMPGWRRAGSGSHTRGRVATSSAAAPFLQVTAHLDAPEDTPPRGGAAACVGCPLTLVLELGLAQQILLLGRCIVLPGPHSFSALPIGAIEAAEAAAAVGTLGRPPLAQAERASDGEAATVVAGAQLSLQLDMPQPLVVVLTAAELPLSRLDARPPPPVIAEASQLSVPVLRMPRLHPHLSDDADLRRSRNRQSQRHAPALCMLASVSLSPPNESDVAGARDPGRRPQNTWAAT